MLNPRQIQIIAGLSGSVCVALGALGAHALKQQIPSEQLDIFETGIKYHFYHTLALLVISWLLQNHASKFLQWSAVLFITGIFIFSFSLYFLAARPLFGIPYDALKWIGAITPLGGLSFILAWLMLIFAALKK